MADGRPLQQCKGTIDAVPTRFPQTPIQGGAKLDTLLKLGERALLPLVVALLASCWVAWALRRRGRRWTLILLVVAPALTPLNALWRDNAYHALMHASIVYQIADYGLAPENPLLAGEPLRYPYLQHWIAAFAYRGLGLSPGATAALANLAALLSLSAAVWWLALLVSSSRAVASLAVVLAVYGASPASYGPLWLAAQQVGFSVESRLTPFNKFMSCETNAAGLACYAVSVLGCVAAICHPKQSVWGCVCLFAGLVGGGLLYPLNWLGAWASIVVAASVELVVGPIRQRPYAGVVLGVAVLCAALVYPYLASISSGKPSGLRLAYPFEILTATLPQAMLACALPLAVIHLFGRSAASESSHPAGDLRVLATVAGVGIAMAAFMRVPMDTQYKFMMASYVPLAVIMAVCLFRDGAPRVVPIVVTTMLCLLPAADKLREAWLADWRYIEPLASVDGDLVRTDEANQRIDDWIRRETAADAVLIDGSLATPCTARRTLYVGAYRLPSDLPALWHDGWGMPDWLFLGKVTGGDLDMIDRRRRIAFALLSAREQLPLGWAEQIAADVGGRPVYLIARSMASQRTARGLSLPVRYENEAGAVFELSGPARAHRSATKDSRDPAP